MVQKNLDEMIEAFSSWNLRFFSCACWLHQHLSKLYFHFLIILKGQYDRLFAYMTALSPSCMCRLLFPSKDKIYFSTLWTWAFCVIFLYQWNAVEMTLYSLQAKEVSVFILLWSSLHVKNLRADYWVSPSSISVEREASTCKSAAIPFTAVECEAR